MANGIRELGAIQSVEVKFPHSMTLEVLHLFDRNGRRDQFARVRVIVQSFEAPPEPRRDLRSATSCKLGDLWEPRNRQNARHDAHIDSLGRALVAKAQVGIVIEE